MVPDIQCIMMLKMDKTVAELEELTMEEISASGSCLFIKLPILHRVVVHDQQPRKLEVALKINN